MFFNVLVTGDRHGNRKRTFASGAEKRRKALGESKKVEEDISKSRKISTFLTFLPRQVQETPQTLLHDHEDKYDQTQIDTESETNSPEVAETISLVVAEDESLTKTHSLDDISGGNEIGLWPLFQMKCENIG